MRRKKPKTLFKEVMKWIFGVLMIFVITIVIVIFVADRTRVNGTAMSPALENGDLLLVDKISYRYFDPKRFDVVVFPFQYQEETIYLRRVIGLPGETIQIRDGVILINGSPLQDPYGDTGSFASGLAHDPITLQEDEYFVLCDNRSNTSDSREPSVENVSKDVMIGKAVFRYWPLDRIGFVK